MDAKRSFRTDTVFQLPTNTDGKAFARLLHQRQVAVSEDGRHFFHIGRAANSDGSPPLRIVGSSTDTPAAFADIRLLEVRPDGVLFWGRGGQTGESGVYKISGERVTFLERLHRLETLRETPGGLLLQGRNDQDAPGAVRYVLPNGRGFILVAEGTQVSIGADGSVATLERQRHCWSHRLWHRDGRETELRSFPPGRRVLAVPWQNSYAYVLDRGHEFSFEAPGIEPSQVFRGHVECLWNSPSQRHVFFLVRDPPQAFGTTTRRLYLDGELVSDAVGSFKMDQDDLRWSADDSQFVAKISLAEQNAKGFPAYHDRLITSRGEVYDAPPGRRISNMAVDNVGEISFFVQNDGSSQVPYVYREPAPAVACIWNLQDEGRRLRGNLLDADGFSIKCFDLAT
jgi:hypothetical protein